MHIDPIDNTNPIQKNGSINSKERIMTKDQRCAKIIFFTSSLLTVLLFWYLSTLQMRATTVTNTFSSQPPTPKIVTDAKNTSYSPACSQISYELTDLYFSSNNTEPPAELFANCAGFMN